MKKIILKILISSLALGVGTVALAQTPRLENLKEKVASSTVKRTAVVQKIAEHRFTKMIARYEATIAREEIIMNRLLSRIEKIKTAGGNTEAAEILMADAKVQLDKAKTALELLKTAIDSTIAAENASTSSKITRDGFTSMRKAGNDIEKYLREAHKDMQKAIGVLRGVSALHNATSTRDN